MKSEGNKLTRAYMLKNKKLIASLFDRNNVQNMSIAQGSLRIIFRFIPLTPHQTPYLIAFSSGKHKKAVRRNQIKRYLRATFQNSSHCLPFMPNHQLIGIVLYRGKPEEARARIPLDFELLLQKINLQTR